MSPLGGPGERLRMAGVALLAVTLAVGGLAGAALHRVFADGDVTAAAADRRGDNDGEDRRERRGFPHDILGTTADQRAAIDAAIERSRARTDALWKEYEPRYRATVDTARAEIRAILTDVQIAKFDSLREARRRRSHEDDRSRSEESK